MAPGRSKRNKDAASGGSKMEQYKQFCPPSKQKDLNALVKAMHGNETQIMAKIQEWWDEPQPTVEPEWENVNKKGTKKQQQQQPKQSRQSKESKPQQTSNANGNTTSGTSGRGGRGGGGGRASQRGRGGRTASEGRGRGRRSPLSTTNPAPAKPIENDSAAANATNVMVEGVPKPVVAAPAPKGAWGQAAPASAPRKAPVSEQPVKVEDRIVSEPYVEVGMVATSDPTPSGLPSSAGGEKPLLAPSPGGNVWATKGSAHLIQAENPLAPPPPPPSRRAPKRMPLPVEETKETPPLESALPPAMNGGKISTSQWNGTPLSPPTSSVAPPPLGVVQVPPSPKTAPPPAPKPVPVPVLNMGHWESGEGDDSQNLDFGFGSFGNESDSAAVQSSPSKDPNTMSPARPPPGLSIGGMPPMPANAVLVHELENKLESTSLGPNGESPVTAAPKAELATASQPAPQDRTSGPPPLGAPPGVMSQPQNYGSAYGMGAYNYTAPGGSGFVGVPSTLPGPPPPQSKPPSGIGGQPPGVSGPPGGLYGASNSNNDSSNAPPSSEVSGTNTATGMPPGIPGTAMPYNPALFYGQQPYQMGQPHGGVGYGYGYGAQFGGGAAFGYQQNMMGQSGGYGGHYDDQTQQRGDGGYQNKNNSGYRGRNSNQYAQTQYGPGGYGGQPYGIAGGYEHFGGPQRGGYGPGGMDPYSMQQQQQQQPQGGGGGGGGNYQSGGIHTFQDDEHKGGRKEGRNGNLPPPQQGYQQGQPLQQQGQPPFGLQGGGGNGSSGSNTNNGRGGWSNQAGGGGGWGGGPSWQH